MSIFGALSIAGQALLSTRNAITSTTKNINNAYTDGYTREEPIFADVPGGGVKVKELRRLFDRALFTQRVKALSENNGYSEEYSILSQIESVFDDIEGSGFSNEINQFFSSLNDIALKPDDIAARESFLSAAQALVGRIRQSYQALDDIEKTYSDKVRDSITKLNDLLKELSDVNRSLPLYKDSLSYNQYLDQRDKLIEEISTLIDAKVVIHEDNTVDLFTAKGFPLVLRERAFPLSLEFNSNGIEVKTQGADISGDLLGGTIGGMLKGIREVKEFKERLNTFTSVFAQKVNQQQQEGYDLYGNSGEPLFSSDNSQPIDASNIVLAISDPKKVAAAASPTNLNSDNENVKKLIELGDEKIPELGNLSFSEYYANQITALIGSKASTVKNLFDNSTFRLNSITEKLKEISGVNIDEELLKLTKFQRSYEAAAKVVNVSDELLQTILNMVG
ncbi:flagellar hook-associated protein FlgK [Thermovibrio sp.]